MSRLYHRTAVGRFASKGLPAGVSAEALRVLRSIREVRSFAEIARAADGCRRDRLAVLLEELEAAGAVESVPLQWLAELIELGSYEPTPLSA